MYLNQWCNGIGKVGQELYRPKKNATYVSKVDPHSPWYLFSWSGLLLKHGTRTGHCYYFCHSVLDASTLHSI